MGIDLGERGINIKDLVIDEPQRSKVLFDPKKEITEDDLQHFIEYFEKFKKLSPQSSLELAAAIKIAKPEFLSRFTLDQDILNDIAEDLEDTRKRKLWLLFAKSAVSVKILFPDLYKKLNLTEDDRLGMIQDVQTGLGILGFERYQLAGDIAILFPDHLSSLNSQEDLWQGINSELSKLEEQRLWSLFADIAVCRRILFPGKDTSLSEDIWLELMEKKSRIRKTSYKELSGLARDFTLLTAKDIKITKSSFEFTPQDPSFSEAIPQLPERRKF